MKTQSHIPSLKWRLLLVAAVISTLVIGGGVALATSPSQGVYEPRINRVVPLEKAHQVEHSLAPSEPDSGSAAIKAEAATKSRKSAEATAPELDFDSIPAGLIAADAPVPLSPELIKVENAWLASDGQTLTAVYAGVAGNDPARGRFVIVRQDLAAGNQTMDVVDVPGTGALTIIDAPRGAAVEKSAQRGRLCFAGSHGHRGELDLSGDKVDAS
jgi:hypothetical protein